MTPKCIWCKNEKADEAFDNPALGVCRECNEGAKEKHIRYLEWRKEHPRRGRRIVRSTGIKSS